MKKMAYWISTLCLLFTMTLWQGCQTKQENKLSEEELNMVDEVTARMANKLALTPEQTVKVKELNLEYLPSMRMPVQKHQMRGKKPGNKNGCCQTPCGDKTKCGDCKPRGKGCCKATPDSANCPKKNGCCQTPCGDKAKCGNCKPCVKDSCCAAPDSVGCAHHKKECMKAEGKGRKVQRMTKEQKNEKRKEIREARKEYVEKMKKVLTNEQFVQFKAMRLFISPARGNCPKADCPKADCPKADCPKK